MGEYLIFGGFMRIVLCLLMVVICTPFSKAQVQDEPFTKRLVESRYTLQISAGSFTGTGAPVLADALSKARYIMIGEDHGTREIPQFTQAVCDQLAPQGLTAYAVEAGPLAASTTAATLNSPERLQIAARIQQQYPDSIAFLNLKEENDLAAHCRAAVKGEFALWGLDQEFLGSFGLILNHILKTPLPPAAKAAVESLAREEKIDAGKAMQSGDPGQLFMFSVSGSELENARKLIQSGGNTEAQHLINQLMQSYQIYFKNHQRLPDSNTQRARLMKSNLQDYLGNADSHIRSGKMLFKFGDWHMYRGLNPLLQLDLGNFLSEKADGEGVQALNIIVLGAKGSHLGYAGYGKPYAPETFEMVKDKDYVFMKPFFDAATPDSWALYDLRKFRHTSIGKLSNNMERLVYGFDLLIVIPEVTPSAQIH